MFEILIHIVCIFSIICFIIIRRNLHDIKDIRGLVETVGSLISWGFLIIVSLVIILNYINNDKLNDIKDEIIKLEYQIENFNKEIKNEAVLEETIEI